MRQTKQRQHDIESVKKIVRQCSNSKELLNIFDNFSSCLNFETIETIRNNSRLSKTTSPPVSVHSKQGEAGTPHPAQNTPRGDPRLIKILRKNLELALDKRSGVSRYPAYPIIIQFTFFPQPGRQHRRHGAETMELFGKHLRLHLSIEISPPPSFKKGEGNCGLLQGLSVIGGSRRRRAHKALLIDGDGDVEK